jgi:alanyl-tRNA synthetase
MKSKDLRESFLSFFSSKQHKVVSSAPIVVKNDPTLMFTNAGMNPFKDIFLGNSAAEHKRVANSQKCLRVSGKHNDLEEVGHDTYHHTMFEMLGNWSFGDYFKQEAIDWAWEYLTGVLKIDKSRLYATIFEGNKQENIDQDKEAFDIWKSHLDEDRIILGSKKDNFWEMGETGPCGPCSEIHIDLRSEKERQAKPGKELVNTGHPQVVEIWNLVFIQFNRKTDGVLELLPKKHVDTGMGFERLCMAIQGKTSNYDTDIFQPLLQAIAKQTEIKYGDKHETDVAMRVIADHIRAVSFAIADGQIPSNAKAGYVIRRILRRAIRYNYTFLNQKEPSIYLLVKVLGDIMGDAYPELIAQKQFIEGVIREEEASFLRTLESGIKLLNILIKEANKQGIKEIRGASVFELYDTYGFPYDLTELILRESSMGIDKIGFDKEMTAQKERSRQAATKETGDWVVLRPSEQLDFIGYDHLIAEILIVKYRKVSIKDKDLYQLVFNQTPFYGESGGQVGDIGFIESEDGKVEIIDTQKENNLIIHISNKLPVNPAAHFTACVNKENRIQIAANHTATHLLHKALRNVLGNHVEQKGSLVNAEYLRFDFSHYQKLSKEELAEIESQVNEMIRLNNHSEIQNMPIKEAQKLGAMALFGEKYGNEVRVVKFGDSVELCGGTHADHTGNIGYFKIFSETSIASGTRRIVAGTGKKAEIFVSEQLDLMMNIAALLNNPNDITKAIISMGEQNAEMSDSLERFRNDEVKRLKAELINNVVIVNGISCVVEKLNVAGPVILKNLAFQMRAEIENLYLVLAAEVLGKPQIVVAISDKLVKEKNLNANNIVKELAKDINGGGGGQPFYATAGGTSLDGLLAVKDKALNFIR